MPLPVMNNTTEMIWKGSLKEDHPAQQIQIFEQFVAQDVGGIVLAQTLPGTKIVVNSGRGRLRAKDNWPKDHALPLSKDSGRQRRPAGLSKLAYAHPSLIGRPSLNVRHRSSYNSSSALPIA